MFLIGLAHANEEKCLAGIDLFIQKKIKKLPDLTFQNSHAQLLDSVKAILKSNKSVAATVQDEVLLMGQKLESGFKEIYPNLPAAVSNEISLRLQKILCDEFSLSWNAHLKYLEAKSLPTNIDHKLFVAIPEILSREVKISRDFDIPTIAGYSKGRNWTVFFDRDLPEKTKEGVTVLFPLLLHETVEKILIETAGLSERIYFRTHQIAQRLEKAWIQEAGHSWNDWQHGAIDRFSNLVEKKKLTHIAPNLDPLPYLDAKMLKAWSTILQHYNSAKDLFTPRLVAANVLHLDFNDQVQMAEAVFRFQEHFESPKFKNKIFTRDEFKQWYFKENNTTEFTYTEVDAFNFPSNILKPFFAGQFAPLNPAEKSLLELFSHMPENFYVTMSVKGGDPSGFEHEMSHALYFLDREYHDRVNAVLAKYDLTLLKKFIFEELGDYHPDVLHDEAHAWLLHNEKDLRTEGFDTAPLLELRKELRAIYEEKKFR